MSSELRKKVVKFEDIGEHENVKPQSGAPPIRPPQPVVALSVSSSDLESDFDEIKEASKHSSSFQGV